MTCSTPPEAARRAECNALLSRVVPCRVLKVTVGAPGHSNLVPHQQKCCCVISKGRAFHRPTSHPPAPMGSSRTRKTVGFKSSSNKKPLGPLVQKQSTPQPNQPHGRAQLDMGVLLMWLGASSESSQGNRTQGDIPLLAVAVSSQNTFLLEFGFETSTQM